MSINWTTRDLAKCLKTDVVSPRHLRVGDVVVDDYGVWQVAKIAPYGRGRHRGLEFSDADDNGLRVSLAMKGYRFTIIARAALRSEP